ncbi:MAG: hypothetical protein RL220_1071 [Bacteroidota bacterium]|jgi:uncharacterized protein (DUF1684 family)
MKQIFRVFFISAAILISGAVGSRAQETWQDLVEKKRKEKDAEFSNPETTILPDDELTNFHGLDYFPVNEDYRVKMKFKKIKDGKEFKMKTTTTRTPVYVPYGTLKFKVRGKKCELTVYQNKEISAKPGYEDYLFLPFTDLTNGESTYGGGRYLDMRIGDLDKRVLDFNECYNPYCAYNPKYSCPVPPSENSLPLAIEAGVKKFHD